MYRWIRRLLPEKAAIVVTAILYTAWIAAVTVAAAYFPTVGFRYLDI